MAAAVDVPVVNLLSDAAHPCQALADLLTLQRGRSGRSKGAASRTSATATTSPRRSRIAAALSGIEIVVASPAGYELDADVVDRARNLGGAVELRRRSVRRGARRRRGLHRRVDVDGPGRRAERRGCARSRAGRSTRDLMKAASDDAVFLHCLPAHRGEEVTAEVIDGPQSRRVAAGREPHARRARAVRRSRAKVTR